MKRILSLVLILATFPVLAIELPERWIYTPSQLPSTPGDSDWSSVIQDPCLDSLMTFAANANYDIRQAAISRSIAANSIRQARSAYWPQLSLSAAYTHEREHRVSSNQYNLGASMSWEIDIFGRVNASVKQKKADFRASVAELQGAKLSIAAEIATYYINYRLLQERIALTERHIARQQKVVDIAQARHDAGLVSKLDVTQAMTVLHTTEATLPAMRSELRSTLTAIAAILATFPDSIPVDLSRKQSLPEAQLPAAGIPANLLRRRPDVIAAEARLASSAAAIGIARKEFLPVLSLQGEIGTSATSPDKLFSNGSLNYSIAPTLTWTAFDGLNRHYGLEQARLEMEDEINAYNLTVINAVGEVDNAFAAYLSAHETSNINTKQLEQANESLTLALNLYTQGLTAFSNVVDAQVSLLSADNDLLSSRGNTLTAIINLYKALGDTPNK